MPTLVDLLIEKRKKEEKYFKNYLKWAKVIKKEAQRLLKEVEVFVFGSIVRGEAEPGSDIDILIVSSELKTNSQKSKIRAQICKKIGFGLPFELHLLSPEEYENWYKFFLKEKIKV